MVATGWDPGNPPPGKGYLTPVFKGVVFAHHDKLSSHGEQLKTKFCLFQSTFPT